VSQAGGNLAQAGPTVRGATKTHTPLDGARALSGSEEYRLYKFNPT